MFDSVVESVLMRNGYIKKDKILFGKAIPCPAQDLRNQSF